MNACGFAGAVLILDLSRNEIRIEPTDPGMARDFIGGLGLSIKLAADHIEPKTHALSPQNPIVIGAGPLVGTNLPASSRVYAVSKLPASKTIGWCGGGGAQFGYLLKNAGFDHIVIKGKADRPVYVKIENDHAEICDAAFLWNTTVDHACDALWEKEGKPAGIICIGQAGENQVGFSMAFIDRVSTLGRGGLGAVMGSKNLKAILVKGNKGIQIADRQPYDALNKKLVESITGYPYLKEWQELGMLKSFPAISTDLYKAIKKRRIACVSCPVGCKDAVEIPDGRFKGLIKYTSSVVNLFTPMMYGLKDPYESIRLMTVIDGYGLDMFEFFSIIQFAGTAKEKGLLCLEPGEPDIIPDSLDSMEAWAQKISLRQGTGNLLADGFEHIIETIGPAAIPYAPPLIKGMNPYAGPGSAIGWDLFGTMELGQLLDPRGPHVGAGGSPTYFAKRPVDAFPKHLARIGIPDDVIKQILPSGTSLIAQEEIKVGRLLKYSHAWFTILGSLGLCARAGVNRFYNAKLCADLYASVTGIQTDVHMLNERVERIWTLLRVMNIREGMGKKEETPPEKWFGPSGFKNYASGKLLSRNDVEEMISDYFAEWGWDRKTGVPGENVLRKLGLDQSRT